MVSEMRIPERSQRHQSESENTPGAPGADTTEVLFQIRMLGENQ
jgi:hypothetical protein